MRVRIVKPSITSPTRREARRARATPWRSRCGSAADAGGRCGGTAGSQHTACPSTSVRSLSPRSARRANQILPAAIGVAPFRTSESGSKFGLGFVQTAAKCKRRIFSSVSSQSRAKAISRSAWLWRYPLMRVAIPERYHGMVFDSLRGTTYVEPQRQRARTQSHSGRLRHRQQPPPPHRRSNGARPLRTVAGGPRRAGVRPVRGSSRPWATSGPTLSSSTARPLAIATRWV